MNTTEFIHNIDSDNISLIIANFFDEIMVLYNLVGSREDLSISSDSNASLATFMLVMDSDEQALELYESLNNKNFSVYENNFYINMYLSGNRITTVITQATR
jgi:hypothetical protein